LSRYRVIPSGISLQFPVEELKKAIDKDKEAGLIPFFVFSTVGTTATTAMDNITELGKLCQEENLWLHVDAAFAGSACICPEYRHLINGVEYANSFNFNPHKWLLTNFDCSALWIKNRKILIKALSVLPEILRNKVTETGAVIDYRDWQVPLGRRFRALKLWSVIRTYGVSGLQDHIRKHCKLAEIFENLVRKDDRFEIVQPRVLSLVTFRAKNSNEFNQKLEETINEAGKIYISHSAYQNQYFLRFSIGGTHTQLEHIQKAWEIIKIETEKLLQQSN